MLDVTLMAPRARLSWQQIARVLFFIVLHALCLGALIGASILGVKAALEPSLAPYIGGPMVFAVIFAYGKWVWTPLWKQRVSKQWT